MPEAFSEDDPKAMAAQARQQAPAAKGGAEEALKTIVETDRERPDPDGPGGGMTVRLGEFPPPKRGVVISECDAEGTPGELDRSILEHTGIDPATPFARMGRTPHAYFAQTDAPILLARVVTRAEGSEPRELIFKNLLVLFSHGTFRRLFDTIPSESATIWLPLLGTDWGGLSYRESVSTMLEAFAQAVSDWSLPVRTTLILSFPTDWGEFAAEMEGLVRTHLPGATVEVDIPAPRLALQTAYETDAPFHGDQPVGTDEDTLDRKAIAEAIAQKVVAVWRGAHRRGPDGQRIALDRPDRPFIVHLAGRWGSGKSSILNFLRDILAAETSVTPPPRPGQVAAGPPEGWLVVDFNAWRHQKTGPAWWALMTRLAETAKADLSGPARRRFAWRERVWKLRSQWIGWAVALAMTLVIALIWPSAPDADGGDPAFLDRLLGAIGPIAAAFTAVAGIMAFSSRFMPRVNRTAQEIQNLTSDPTTALADHFTEMVETIGRPVAIFVDDLDRCDAAYVVELLQALQTVYARAGVLYVVAADRDWIVSAYDQVYEGFDKEIARPGQPLGYLFVKKVFQLSVAVPELGADEQEIFLKSLLPGALDMPLSEVETQEIRQAIEKAGSLDEIVAFTESLGEDSRKRRAAGRAVLEALTTEEGTAKTQHLLVEKLCDEAHLLDSNPRFITRLVNAYSFRLGAAIRTGDPGVIERLPYWCVLDLRYPLAARRLAEKPELALMGAWERDDEEQGRTGNDRRFSDEAGIGQILARLLPGDVEKLRKFG